MSEQWYYVKAGERCGPVPEEELKATVARGDISPAALVWQSGMSDWKPYSELFPGDGGSADTASEPAGAEASSPKTPADSRRESRCANCSKECAPENLNSRNGRMLCPDCNKAFAVTDAGAEGKNGKAIAGFCLAILSVGCCGGCIFSILGFIFSVLGLSDYNRKPEIGGKGLAVAGIVLSVISFLKDIVFLIVALFSDTH